MDIKPIETGYKGYRFRSRLEARWAVFFTELQIPFRYEFEGFRTSDGSWYLPDFWLPSHHYWIEIKAQEPNEEESRRLVDVVNGTKKRGFIFFGDVWVPNDAIDSAYAFWPGIDGCDGAYWWCECPKCGKLDIQWAGQAQAIDCSCAKDGIGENIDSPRLIGAYTAARQARF
jgi:hypothetical protein